MIGGRMLRWWCETVLVYCGLYAATLKGHCLCIAGRINQDGKRGVGLMIDRKRCGEWMEWGFGWSSEVWDVLSMQKKSIPQSDATSSNIHGPSGGGLPRPARRLKRWKLYEIGHQGWFPLRGQVANFGSWIRSKIWGELPFTNKVTLCRV